MKKILFVTPDFYPNSTGFANSSINLVDSIIKFGFSSYKLWIVTNVPLGNHDEKNGITVLRYQYKLPINRFTYEYCEYKKYKTISQIVDENQIDIIFFETNTFPFLQNLILRKYFDKVVVRIHSTADTEVPVFMKPKNKWTRKCNKKVFEFMHDVRNILSTSSYYLDFIKCHFLSGNVYNIWNNKTYGLLYNTAGDEISKKPVSTSNTFMTMGKMSYNGVIQKGIEDLLKAVYHLKKQKNIPEDFRLIIVGTGDCLIKIVKVIEIFDLQEYVRIIERASHKEVFELIGKSKAIILLSRYEGQSMFITETLASGKPIIVSDNNGMQDLVINDYNGKLVKTGNPIKAAEALAGLIALPEEAIYEMGDNSYKLYQEKYSPKAVYEQFDEFIKLMVS